MKTLLLSLLLIAAGTMQAQQTTKQLLHHQSDLKIYAYPGSAVITDEYISIWIDRQFTPTSDRAFHINNMLEYIKLFDKNTQIDILQWQKLDGIKEKVCIDTHDNTYKFEQSLYYDTSGNAIYIYKPSDESTWSEVVPGTIFETVYTYAKKLHKQKAPQ